MLAYQRDAERHGATVLLNSSVVGGDVSGAAFKRRPQGAERLGLMS